MSNNKVFISYSHADKKIVNPICQNLETMGFPIWLDRNELAPGDWLSDSINKALEESGAFIAFVGHNYFAEGKYTSQEVQAAEGLALSNPAWRLVPVKLAPSVAMPPMMRGRLWIDYVDAEQTAKELAAVLSRHKQIDGQDGHEDQHMDASKAEREGTPLNFEELTDLDLRLVLNEYLEQRHENLRGSGDMIRFDIRLGGGRRLIFDVMREIAADEGIRGELQHQRDILKVKQRAVEIARKTLARGLAGQFQAGLEIMMEEDFDKIAEAHSILTRHFSEICERPTLIT